MERRQRRWRWRWRWRSYILTCTAGGCNWHACRRFFCYSGAADGSHLSICAVQGRPATSSTASAASVQVHRTQGCPMTLSVLLEAIAARGSLQCTGALDLRSLGGQTRLADTPRAGSAKAARATIADKLADGKRRDALVLGAHRRHKGKGIPCFPRVPGSYFQSTHGKSIPQ